MHQSVSVKQKQSLECIKAYISTGNRVLSASKGLYHAETESSLRQSIYQEETVSPLH